MTSSFPPPVLRGIAQNRVVVSYAAAPNQIAPLLPDGLVPHTRDGNAYVSLAGVELTKVRVLGVSGLGIRRVPAVEMRVHVRPADGDADASGTWTVQAHTSRRLAAWGARFLYREPRDYMRRVSAHVSIGEAHRLEKKVMGWFILCRED